MFQYIQKSYIASKQCSNIFKTIEICQMNIWICFKISTHAKTSKYEMFESDLAEVFCLVDALDDLNDKSSETEDYEDLNLIKTIEHSSLA